MDEQLIGRATQTVEPPLTWTERLREERARLHQRMASIDRALAMIEANPGVEGVIEALLRAGVR